MSTTRSAKDMLLNNSLWFDELYQWLGVMLYLKASVCLQIQFTLWKMDIIPEKYYHMNAVVEENLQ